MLHFVVRISSNYNTKHNTIVSATVTTIFTCLQCTVHAQSLACSVQYMNSHLRTVYSACAVTCAQCMCSHMLITLSILSHLVIKQSLVQSSATHTVVLLAKHRRTCSSICPIRRSSITWHTWTRALSRCTATVHASCFNDIVLPTH